MKKLPPRGWLEFIFSGVPGVDWYYALTYTPTRLERVMFPEFVTRPQRDWIIATAEHSLYLLLGFAYVQYVSVEWSIAVGAFALFVVVPLEFILYKFKIRIFRGLSWTELAVFAAWNIFNACLYWGLGSVVALAV